MEPVQKLDPVGAVFRRLRWLDEFIKSRDCVNNIVKDQKVAQDFHLNLVGKLAEGSDLSWGQKWATSRGVNIV